MTNMTASTVRPTAYTALRTMICATAALAALAIGQVPSPPKSPSYPLGLGTRWTYEMRQEFGSGVRPSELDAAVVKGNVLETTLVSEVAGADLIRGIRYVRVESRHDGRVWMTEWLRLTAEGLFLGKTNENGNETVLMPPQKILSAHMSTGESWTWKASDAPVNILTRVVGKEATDVPAGRFDATKAVHELSMILPQAMIRSVNTRWFISGMGYVRQESETYAGERLLTRTRLRLVAFAPAQAAQARWDGALLNETAAPDLRIW